MGQKIDLDKMRSIGHISRRSGTRVREGRDTSGKRWKSSTDELGNTVTERFGDRQDVTINAPSLNGGVTVNEER